MIRSALYGHRDGKPAKAPSTVVCRGCAGVAVMDLGLDGQGSEWRLERDPATGALTLRGPHGLVLKATVKDKVSKAALEWLASTARQEWPGSEGT